MLHYLGDALYGTLRAEIIKVVREPAFACCTDKKLESLHGGGLQCLLSLAHSI